MDVETFLLTLLSVLIGAAVGSVATYLGTLAIARHQRLHEIRQQAYTGMLPIIEDSVRVMPHLKNLNELDFSKHDEYPGLVARIFGTAAVLGDNDTAYALYEVLSGYEGGEDPEKMQGLLETMQQVATLGLYLRIGENKTDLRTAAGALNFAKPTERVDKALSNVLSLLSEDELDMSMRSLMRASGLGGAVPKLDLAARWNAYTAALEELKAAINEELGKILSAFPLR